jgi:hypothetical protein
VIRARTKFMAIAVIVISVLGLTVIFKADDWPVALLFVGLTCVYVSEFFAGLFMRMIPGSHEEPRALNALGERALGFSRLRHRRPADVPDLRRDAQHDQRHAPTHLPL